MRLLFRGSRWLLPLSLVLLGGCMPKATWHRNAQPIPQVAPKPKADAPAYLAGKGGQGRVHVVSEGENLYRIALRYGVDLDELMDLNQISDERNLAIGRELALPPSRGGRGGAAVAAAPKRATPSRPQAQPKAQQASSTKGSRPPTAQARPGLSRRPPDEGTAPTFIWPVKGVVYSRFGARGASRHDGVDIAAPEGTPIVAAADGEVIFSGVQRGYGNLIILRHEGGLVTIYAHNRDNHVKEGAKVRKGQQIAKVGSTGRTTGPHLHFEIREGTKPLDPQKFLP